MNIPQSSQNTFPSMITCTFDEGEYCKKEYSSMIALAFRESEYFKAGDSYRFALDCIFGIYVQDMSSDQAKELYRTEVRAYAFNQTVFECNLLEEDGIGDDIRFSIVGPLEFNFRNPKSHMRQKAFLAALDCFMKKNDTDL